MNEDEEYKQFLKWKKMQNTEIEDVMNEGKLVIGHPVVDESQNITIEKLKEYLPKGTSAKLSQSIVDEINSIQETSGLPQEYMEERIMSKMHMIKGKGVTVKKMVDALKYSELCKHYTNEKAWAIIRPTEYKRLVDNGQFIASHVSSFESRPMVQQFKKEAILDPAIEYRPFYHEAMMVNVNLMRGIGAKEDDRVSATVQQLASCKVLDMTAPDRENTININVGQTDESKAKEDETINELRKIGLQQQQLIAMGKSVTDVQALNLTVTSVEDDIEDAEVL